MNQPILHLFAKAAVLIYVAFVCGTQSEVVKRSFEAEYVGCFKERPSNNGYVNYNPSDRLPNYFAMTDGQMTIERCVDFCRFKKYTYAALQASSNCLCGDEYYHQEAFDCTMSCTGNPAEKCGNAWTNSIYSVCAKGIFGSDCQYICDYCDGGRCVLSTGECIADGYDKSQYIGCFKERPTPSGGYANYDNQYRQPNYFAFQDGFTTVQRCIDSCREKKYTYAALQAKTWCFCGDEYHPQQAFDCSMPCSGNPYEMCGNLWTNSVYSVCKKGKYGPTCNDDCEEGCDVCLISSGFCP